MWTAPTTAGTYTITATSVDEPSVSVTTTITISAPIINIQPQSQHVCTNSGLLLLPSAASYASSYQWKSNGAPNFWRDELQFNLHSCFGGARECRQLFRYCHQRRW